jgi:hypothetical protein
MKKWLGGGRAALVLLLAGFAPAAAQAPQIATIERVDGQVSVRRDAAQLRPKRGDSLYASDVIVTGADGSVGIAFTDKTIFSSGPNSEVALREFHFDPASSTGALLADVKHGTLSVVSGNLVKGSPGAMKIKTPTAVLNVRGTTFLVKVD